MSDSETIAMLVEQNSILVNQTQALILMLTDISKQSSKKKNKIRPTLPSGDVFLSAHETALILGVCSRTLRTYRKDGLIVYSNPFARNYRYSQNSITEFLTSKKN